MGGSDIMGSNCPETCYVCLTILDIFLVTVMFLMAALFSIRWSFHNLFNHDLIDGLFCCLDTTDNAPMYTLVAMCPCVSISEG